MKSAVFAVLIVICLCPSLLAQPVQAERIAYDVGGIYDAMNSAIVKVYADSAQGSGFVIADNGFIVTNHHVVRNARYLAVQFANGRKYAVNTVVLDPRFDLALLRVNPAAVENCRPLALLPEAQEDSVRPGIPVLAFGSPLSQTFLMTQGIVAKVEETSLLGDFLIQPGNSGGPLVNLQGEVIGINTFAEGRISGAVRVRALRRLLSSDAVQQHDAPPPSDRLLPTLSSQRFPTDVLRTKVLSEAADLKRYQMDGGKFTVTVMTPVMLGRLAVREEMLQVQNRLQRRGKKVNDPSWREVDGPFYEWVRDASNLLQNAVAFEIKPDFGTTAGTKWANFGMAMASLSGSAVSPTRQTMEFKAEFDSFQLFKDGELVEPVTPGRAITEQALQEQFMSFVDEAYSGYYVYSPEVFFTGQEFRLVVFDAREPGRAHKVITLPANSPVIQQIRSDFKEVLGK